MGQLANLWKTLSPGQQLAAKLVGASGAGASVAALENKYLGEFLPEQLKTINLGIGGGTGAAAILGGRKALTGALLGVPLKQMALMGIGSLEKSRAQQRDLMGLQLSRALTDLQTSQIGAQATADQLKDRKFHNILAALGIGSAGLGAGALAAYVHDNRKYTDWHEAREKEKEERRKNRELSASKGNKGPIRDKVRIKIDLPSRAAPPEFIQSLMNIDDNEKARTSYSAKKAFFHVFAS